MLKSIRRIPADLASVVAITVLMFFTIFSPELQESSLRMVLGIPFLLFLPGYAFISAVFPSSPSNVDEEEKDERYTITGVERIVLAVGLSVAFVSLLGLILRFTVWGIQFTPITLTVGGFTIGCTGIAVLRRWELPAEERFSVSLRKWVATAWTKVYKPTEQTDTGLNVTLALLIIFTIGIVGFAVASSPPGEQFTRFYLLSENDEGELVARDYPTSFVQGEAQSIIIGIDNQEFNVVEYSIVIQLERVESKENQTNVQEREVLDQVNTTLDHNETEEINYEMRPPITGEELRMVFLLYKGDPPEKPTRENSYRDLHLWITVEESDIQEPIEIPN